MPSMANPRSWPRYVQAVPLREALEQRGFSRGASTATNRSTGWRIWSSGLWSPLLSTSFS